MSLGEQYLDIQHKILEPWTIPKHVGSYTVKRALADGGFSKVYLAEHQFSGLEVVLKCAPKTLPNLVSEIMNLSMFDHPHIIRLYEIIISQQEVWLVLEYCHGEELLSYLQRGPCENLAAVQYLFTQLCGAVAYIHARHHCAHRDIKLENILLDSMGNLKLADFGFTRNYSSKSLLDTICGTTPYMAPELLNGEKYTPEATDIWSLGVILYALIYAQLPFDEDNELNTKVKILKATPAYPEMPALTESPALLVLLQKMLSKNPRSRPSARAVLCDPVWGSYGQRQLEVLNTPITPQFSTRAEKAVLKGLSVLKIDLQALNRSLTTHACDPLHGLWFTLLEKQRQKEEVLSRRKSDAPSLRSVRRVARTLARGAAPISPHSTRVPSQFSRLAYHSDHSLAPPSTPQLPPPRLELERKSTSSSEASSNLAKKSRFRERLRILFSSRGRSPEVTLTESAVETTPLPPNPEVDNSMPPIAEEQVSFTRQRTVSQISEFSSLSDMSRDSNRYLMRASIDEDELAAMAKTATTATATAMLSTTTATVKKMDSPIKKIIASPKPRLEAQIEEGEDE